LTVTAVSSQEIDLTWTPPQNTTGLGKYLIFSGPTPSSLVQIAIVPAANTTYRNLPLSPATTYYYGVEAVEDGIDSSMSPLASAVTPPLPNPPNNLAAAPTPTSIVLTWQENAAPGGLPISFYKVLEGTAPGQLVQVATVGGTTYEARSLNATTTYYFEVVAVDTAYDNSAPSSEISAATLPMPPPPTNLSASAPAATQVALTWQWAPLSGGLPISRYLIDCGTSRSNLPQVGVTTNTAYTYRSASPSTTYYCEVIAVDSDNNDSQPSGLVAVTTPPMPAAPVDVVATATYSTVVTVTWSENIPRNGLPIQGYTIFRGTTPGNLTDIATRTAAVFTDTTVSPDTKYYYAVEATDTGRDVSPMSATAQVTTP
jgi:fibronectin type 3 domain-containing protein